MPMSVLEVNSMVALYQSVHSRICLVVRDRAPTPSQQREVAGR